MWEKWYVTEMLLTSHPHKQCDSYINKTSMDYIFQVQFYIPSGSICSFIADGTLLVARVDQTCGYESMFIPVFYAILIWSQLDLHVT